MHPDPGVMELSPLHLEVFLVQPTLHQRRIDNFKCSRGISTLEGSRDFSQLRYEVRKSKLICDVRQAATVNALCVPIISTVCLDGCAALVLFDQYEAAILIKMVHWIVESFLSLDVDLRAK
ncbi:hypothetical protein D9M68_700290 [compost metagenome]